MEVEKRKRTDNGEADRKKARWVTTEPEEDEVEEFFAILRRIHVAVKYFKKAKVGEGSRRELTAQEEEEEESSRRSPLFQPEDFGEVDDAKGPCEVEVEVAGLDLNADPKSDSESKHNSIGLDWNNWIKP